jgi:hypothetical protein
VLAERDRGEAAAIAVEAAPTEGAS